MAVFTDVERAQADAFVARYDVGRLTAFRGIAEGVENTNFFVQTERGRFVLTLFEKRVRAQDLPFYLGLTDHLSARGFPAPRPIAARDGAVVSMLNGRPAALISWLEGAWLRAPSEADCWAAGAMLARLHAASDDYAPTLDNRFGVPAWRALAQACRPLARGRYASMLARLDAQIEDLAATWPTELPRGVIHGDYFPDNILFQDGAVSGVIDYYFACTEMRAYDLAIAINAWCFDGSGAFDAQAAAGFCTGYAEERPLSDAERAALPILCRGAAVRFTLTRLHDVLHHDATWLVTPKDPAPFFRRLDLHDMAEDASIYGLPV